MRRLPAVQFTYDLWAAGALFLIGVENRCEDILNNKDKIRAAAVGYTDGDKLQFRPKSGDYAVMFFDGRQHFWTHLMAYEFEACFPEIWDV